MKDSIERGLRNRKLVDMGLLQVAKAMAEGKVKVTMADLDRLVRLEEYLREEGGPEGGSQGRGPEGSVLEEVRTRFVDHPEEEGNA